MSERYDVSREDGSYDDILTKSDVRTGMMVPEVISGLADIRAESVLPILVGSAGTMVTTYILNRMNQFGKYAPLVGAAGGSLLSLALNYWSRGGSNAVAQGILASAVTGVGMYYANQLSFGKGLFGALVATPTGALVAQPTGALVAQPVGALPAYAGETANMPGSMGPVDVSAYGRV